MTSLEIKAIAYLLSIVALFGAYAWVVHDAEKKGAAACELKTAWAVAQSEADARATEDSWNAKLAQSNKQSDINLQNAQAANDAALAAARLGLRNRPATRAVPSITTPSACLGASPADLSQPDASNLIGLAAAADSEITRLQSDLQRFQAWADTLTGKP